MNRKRNIVKVYIILFVLILLIHFFFSFSNDDITYFSKILDTMNWLDFIKLRYFNWTSRLIIEGLLVFISRNILLWRILDSAIMILFIWCIQKLCFKETSIKKVIFTTSIILLLPFINMTEAGICATTMNYFWPLTLMLFSLIPIRNMYNDNNINKKILPFYMLSALYACNQEQSVCIIFVVSLLTCFNSYRKKSFSWYAFILLLLSTCSIIFILLCPGNAIRSIQEIEHWYVDYENAIFIDKICLGIISSTSILFSYFFVLLFFSLVLWISTLKIQVSKKVKIIGTLQFLIVSLLSTFRVYCFLFHKEFILFDYFTDLGHVLNINNILLFMFCIILFLTFAYLLYSIKKDNRLNNIIILFLGCGTRLLMGFSPTIFASRSRTAIFLYVSLVIIIINILSEIKHLLRKWEINCLCIILSLFIIVNLGILFFKVL